VCLQLSRLHEHIDTHQHARLQLVSLLMAQRSAVDCRCGMSNHASVSAGAARTLAWARANPCCDCTMPNTKLLLCSTTVIMQNTTLHRSAAAITHTHTQSIHRPTCCSLHSHEPAASTCCVPVSWKRSCLSSSSPPHPMCQKGA